jgi:hypothetical protein
MSVFRGRRARIHCDLTGWEIWMPSCDWLNPALFCGWWCGQQRRQMIERRTARVDIEDEIGAGKQFGVHIVRNHLRDGAIAMTREDPVHVRAINRRGPPPREKCRKVETRHDDQAAADLHVPV